MSYFTFTTLADLENDFFKNRYGIGIEQIRFLISDLRQAMVEIESLKAQIEFANKEMK